MKSMMILLGIRVAMVLGMVPIFASQTVGTPLHADPGLDARIRSAPLPRGYQFGRSLPPSIDLEVRWQPTGHREMYRGITSIFIDPDGTIRTVDIHPYAIRGMRVWVSRNRGQTWEVEKETTNATQQSMTHLLGEERVKVVFAPSHMGTVPFRLWPLEVEELIKTEFRGLYKQLARTCSGSRVFLAKAPNDPKTMAFVRLEATGAPTGKEQYVVRIFITTSKGKEWLEINPPVSHQSPLPSGTFEIGGLGIQKTDNLIRLFLGTRGCGKGTIQTTDVYLSEFAQK